MATFMRRYKRNHFWLLISLVLLIVACGDGPSKERIGILMGRAAVLVDETVAPIMEDQIDVFESSYTSAELSMLSLSENELVNALLNDSAQLAIMTRELNDDEREFFLKKKIVPRTVKFATDAIAVITNRSNADSTMTVDELIAIMQGNSASARSLVFDNPNSSTVAYLKRLAGVNKIPESGVYSMETNKEVLKYVHDHPQSVGVIGINWMVQPPADFTDIVANIKILSVKDQDAKSEDNQFYKPTQSNLALNLYPLTRSIYCINVQGKEAVGMGFSSFLHGERGQRLVLKSGLLPDSIPSREIIIRN